MVIDTLTLLLLVAAVVVAMPAFVFAAQVSLSFLHRPQSKRHSAPTSDARPSVAVLIPAHNESLGLIPTLRSLKAQLKPQDQILVVADNCSDDTAAVARQEGVAVVERTNPHQRGKGYALDYGFQHLQAQPKDVLVIVDADCIVAPGALASIAQRAATTGSPVQALYLMTQPESAAATVKQRFSEFAWRVKNQVRPSGMAALGLPCQLMGTGMAFPWELLKRHSLASGHLVEDMQLGLAMASEGHPPLFCAEALVTSTFPTDTTAQETQRTRWEHGHLSLITQELPRFLLTWLRKPSPRSLAMAFDLSVPPLSLLVALQIGMVLVSLAWGLFTHHNLPAMVAVCSLGSTTIAVLLGWAGYGRDLLSVGDLAQTIRYVLWKLPVYAKFLSARQTEWIRSKRHADDK